MHSIIMHLDMDAFFASIEQKVNPSLKGRPVVVGGRSRKGPTVVCSASYEARAFGIESGMSTKEAFRRCPEAIFVPANTARYIYTADRILEILKDYSPYVEEVSIDEFYLDLRGCLKIFGSAEGIANGIKAKINEEFGITCSIGVGPNRLIAKLASKLKKPDGFLLVKPEELPLLLEDLPIEKVPGIGPNLRVYLSQMGINTCGQLARFPEHKLIHRFGTLGRLLHLWAKGEADSFLNYSRQESLPKSMGHSQTLAQDTADFETIHNWLLLLSEMVSRRMRRQNLEGRTVTLTLRDSHFFTFSRQRTFKSSTSDGYQIYQRALYNLNQMDLTESRVRLIGVKVSDLSKGNQRYFSWCQRRRRLLKAMDEINDRFGEFSLFPAACLNIG